VYSRIIPVILVATIILALAIPSTHAGDNVGIHSDFPHARVVVTEVVDGDTIRISPPVYVAGQYRTVVRLADIDAPELNTTEGQLARDSLINLLAQYGGVVYLDIDKSLGVDEYGRIIAVVYIRVDESTLLNVNKWLVDNGYAVVTDYPDNDFDPSKWSLYINYNVVNEKMPTVTRVVLASLPQGVHNATSWGVKVATTPDGNHIGLAFSEYGTYHLWVVILDKNGNVVRRVNLSDVASNYGLVNVTNVFRGMLSIAANNSGFLVAWNQYSALIGTTLRSRITMYTYIPIDTSVPIPYDTVNNQFFYLYSGSYQYHPHTAWYCDASNNCYWIIGYHYLSTSANGRLYFYALQPDLATKIPAGGYSIILTTKTASSDPTGIGVGIDALSGVLYDPVTKSFVWVARNYTDTTGYDLELVKGGVGGTTLVIERISINNSIGDVGPFPELYTSGGNYYTYFNVYPMHTALLGSGGYVLTVYNESTSALAYAVVDLSTNSVNSEILIDRGTATTFYPWIAGGSRWLLAYSTGGYVNFTLVGTDGNNPGLLSLSDRNSAYVRATYDSGSGLFPVVYAVRDLGTGNYNVFLSLVNETDGSISSFIIPINTTGSVGKIPINIVVLPGGSPGTVVVFTVEGNDLVAYYISSNYPESQYPIPIPEFLVAIPIVVATIAGVLLLLLTKKRRMKS
jgi:endonuclease YncB( thermonuclease family)